MLEKLNKPWYMLRPWQLLERFSDTGCVRTLPWGLPLEFVPDEMHGREIVRTGLLEPLVTEALFRLTEKGDSCVDAGANIGHMTSALAFRAGPTGFVRSFEPNPTVYEVLSRNVRSWDGLGVAPIETIAAACSSVTGHAALAMPDMRWSNNGIGSLEGADDAAVTVTVATDMLDRAVDGPIGVLKLDVEGHELQALVGAQDLLDAGAVRDIIFEEHASPPSPVTQRLSRSGYTILGLEFGPRGPNAIEKYASASRPLHHSANYVATRDPDRARARFSPPGWHCLRPRPTLRAVV